MVVGQPGVALVRIINGIIFSYSGITGCGLFCRKLLTILIQVTCTDNAKGPYTYVATAVSTRVFSKTMPRVGITRLAPEARYPPFGTFVPLP